MVSPVEPPVVSPVEPPVVSPVEPPVVSPVEPVAHRCSGETSASAFYTNLVINHPVRTRNSRVVLNLIVAVRRLIKIPNCSEVVPK